MTTELDWDPTEPDAENADADAAGPEPIFPTLDAWVEQWLAPTMRYRPTQSLRWCPQWWAHPEAAARLGALWAAWELAYAQGGSAPSSWWVSDLTSHWHALTDARGPFGACTPNKHAAAEPPLPTTPQPDLEETL